MFIAVDVNNLPNPFSAFKEGLQNRLSKWLHVSGILLFQNYFSQNEIGWEWQLFINPNAKRPLPRQLIEDYGIKSQRMRIVKRKHNHQIQVAGKGCWRSEFIGPRLIKASSLMIFFGNILT